MLGSPTDARWGGGSQAAPTPLNRPRMETPISISTPSRGTLSVSASPAAVPTLGGTPAWSGEGSWLDPGVQGVSKRDLELWGENLKRVIAVHVQGGCGEEGYGEMWLWADVGIGGADHILTPLDDNANRLMEVRDMAGAQVFSQAQLDEFDLDRVSGMLLTAPQ